MTSPDRHTTGAKPAPIACTLTTKDADHQLLEWSELQRSTISTAAIDGGARMTFPVSLEDQIRDLAVRESACCSFLSIAVEGNSDTNTITMDITSANPEALPVINALSGVEIA